VPSLGKRPSKPSAKAKAGQAVKKKAVIQAAAAKRDAVAAAKIDASAATSKLLAVHGEDGAMAMTLALETRENDTQSNVEVTHVLAQRHPSSHRRHAEHLVVWDQA
jgi:hypothetical protein